MDKLPEQFLFYFFCRDEFRSSQTTRSNIESVPAENWDRWRNNGRYG
jgi:hypothetical protein